MLKEVTDIKERCEKVENAAKEMLQNTSSPKERLKLNYISDIARDIKVQTILNIFIEHVKNNMETVKALKTGSDEADEYIRNIMGDTVTISFDIIDGAPDGYLSIHVLNAFFPVTVKGQGREWETIAGFVPSCFAYAPEDVTHIVMEVCRTAEKIGKTQASINKEEESLKNKYPELAALIIYTKICAEKGK